MYKLLNFNKNQTIYQLLKINIQSGFSTMRFKNNFKNLNSNTILHLLKKEKKLFKVILIGHVQV